MFRKILTAILFGASFGVGFVVVIGVALKIYTDRALESQLSDSVQETKEAPEIKNPSKFLDYTGSTSNGFKPADPSILSSGPGEITGKVLSNGMPVEGLQFRLALNSSVYSQYTTTDEKGRYIVAVPYGKYRIDGYSLNMDTAHRVLAGQINAPYMEHVSDEFQVGANQTGRGITLEFVDAIKKNFSEKVYSSSGPIILEWDPYPEANHYSIQLFEKEDPYKIRGNRGIYPLQSRPSSGKPSVNINDYAVRLKPKYFYTARITAFDAKGRVLSYSPKDYYGYDFEVIE